MKTRILLMISILVLASLACLAVDSLFEEEQIPGPEEEARELPPTSIPGTEENPSNNTSAEISIQPIPDNAHEAFDVFEKYVNVFGVHIYADADISDEKVLHTASVMAQYLDNDEDGHPDNPKVLNEMTARDASLFMFNDEGSRDEDRFMDGADELHDAGKALQPSYGFECVPNGAARGEFDATLEEVLHLITFSGYAHAYPDAFGDHPNSDLAKAMDIARGGYFEDVPASYPAGAWYTYDDETCDYPCMISEYIYWALTSLLGGQDFPGRYEEIQHEWKLNTLDKLQSGDPTIYDLLTDPEFNFPTVLPDGNYQPHEQQ